MAPKFGGNLLNFSINHSCQLDLNFAPGNTSSLSAFSSKATSYNFYGSYASDLAGGKYSLSWNTLDMMEAWLRKEEETKFIELRLKETQQNRTNGEWTQKLLYVCARQGTRGNKKYEKRHPKQGRKVPTKWCSCTSHLTIKCYPNTEHILGLYEDNHSQPIGQDNARFTRLPEETRLRMAEMLCMGITHKRIVRCLILLTKYVCTEIFLSYLKYKGITIRRTLWGPEWLVRMIL
jgi:hypothetical protein